MKPKTELRNYRLKPLLWLGYVMLFLSLTKISSAQNDILQQSVSVSYKHIAVGDALDSLSSHLNVYFTYNAQLIDEDRVVSIQQSDTPLSNVLHALLNDSTLHFHVIKRQIVISDVPYPVSQMETDPPTIRYHRQLYGIVLDAHTGSPLPYANIGVLGKMIGTTSNKDGRFHLNYSSSDFSDTVKISFIGYKNKTVILNDSAAKYAEIPLPPDFISLQEVIIRSSDPKYLVLSAIQKFPENYMQQPANYTAFYRESVKKNRNYMIYLESMLDIYKTSYHKNTFDSDAARMVKGRKIYDVNKLDTVSFRLQGGVEGCLLLDVVHNKPDFLLEELFPLYNFSLQNMNTYNDLPVYVIHCSLKKAMNEPLTEGTLYINARDLAIIRCEFYYPEHIVASLSSRFIRQKSAKTKASPTLLSYEVNYQNLNGKYYLSHSHGHLKFKVKNKKRLFANTFEINFEMATTEVDTTNVHKIKRNERLKPDVILSKEMGNYDASYWGKNSFLEPEEDIKDALMRISMPKN